MPRIVPLLALFALCLAAAPARAVVGGRPHQLLDQHRVFGGATVTGNTLMTASIAAPEVNSRLLQSSDGDVRELPFDAEIEAAWLFWSGSIDRVVDTEVDFTTADGTRFDVSALGACATVPQLGGVFYCRADVTDQVRAHPGAQNYNGTYTVGDVTAEPGWLDATGTCLEPEECQGKFAGWSLVLVYSAPSARSLRDVSIHDGFRYLDETNESPGVDRFTVQGFDFPEGGAARLTFFALEGDSFLGVPPQDTDPVFPCDTCFDYMEVNGTPLSDANNPARNLFNSSSPGGFTLGLDIDTFDISHLLDVGASSVLLEPGSGDGISDILPSACQVSPRGS